VVVVINPVSGKSLTENFTGTVRFDQVQALHTRIPSTLPAGKATTFSVRVTNTGIAPMLVQTDARRNGSQTLQLAPQFAGSTFSLPLNVEELSDVPAYLVPPDTKQVAMTASSTVPAQVELSSPGGGIDVFGDLAAAQGGSTISTATVSETKDQVGPGIWFTYVQEIGPYGDGGAPAGSTTISTTATTKPFDPAVASSTGDPYLPAVDPTNDGGTPLVIAPGASGTITVTITPTGKAGTKVNGVLHLVTTPIGVASSFNTTGEVLANLPYSYTIG
ncbi:MAG TPA: hypothetical protein VFU35_12605, partial [Jatrophihabitans sp.]|nr:hypothetical protein [Jatrophihabitans sp.]